MAQRATTAAEARARAAAGRDAARPELEQARRPAAGDHRRGPSAGTGAGPDPRPLVDQLSGARGALGRVARRPLEPPSPSERPGTRRTASRSGPGASRGRTGAHHRGPPDRPRRPPVHDHTGRRAATERPGRPPRARPPPAGRRPAGRRPPVVLQPGRTPHRCRPRRAGHRGRTARQPSPGPTRTGVPARPAHPTRRHRDRSVRAERRLHRTGVRIRRREPASRLPATTRLIRSGRRSPTPTSARGRATSRAADPPARPASRPRAVLT